MERRKLKCRIIGHILKSWKTRSKGKRKNYNLTLKQKETDDFSDFSDDDFEDIPKKASVALFQSYVEDDVYQYDDIDISDISSRSQCVKADVYVNVGSLDIPPDRKDCKKQSLKERMNTLPIVQTKLSDVFGSMSIRCTDTLADDDYDDVEATAPLYCECMEHTQSYDGHHLYDDVGVPNRRADKNGKRDPAEEEDVYDDIDVPNTK